MNIKLVESENRLPVRQGAHLSSDGHHLPQIWGFHGDDISFGADCVQGMRAGHVLLLLQQRGWMGGGWWRWRLAENNDLSAVRLQQELLQLLFR